MRLLIGVTAVICVTVPALAQVRGGNAVPCWMVANGTALTLQCANGYFHSTLPDGTIIDGNGMADPTATNPGSTIPMDGGGSIINRANVQPPPPNQINAAPGQWYYHGGQAPE